MGSSLQAALLMEIVSKGSNWEPWGCRTDIEAPPSTEVALASRAGDHG